MTTTTTTAAFAAALALLAAAALSGLADSAKATTGGEDDDCMVVIMSLAPCLEYTTGESPTPTDECCGELADVAASRPICLCLVFASNASETIGIPIDQTLALALPGACKVKTPPVSECNVTIGGAPAGSPTAAAAPAAAAATGSSLVPAPETPSSTASDADAPAAPGSETTPSSDGGGSYKSIRSLMIPVLFHTGCSFFLFSAIL